jgi:hypothetical protein
VFAAAGSTAVAVQVQLEAELVVAEVAFVVVVGAANREPERPW